MAPMERVLDTNRHPQMSQMEMEGIGIHACSLCNTKKLICTRANTLAPRFFNLGLTRDDSHTNIYWSSFTGWPYYIPFTYACTYSSMQKLSNLCRLSLETMPMYTHMMSYVEITFRHSSFSWFLYGSSRVQGDVLKICTSELYFSARSFMPRKPIARLEQDRTTAKSPDQCLSNSFNTSWLLVRPSPCPPDPEEPAKVWSKSPGPRTGCWLMGLMHPKVIPTGNSSLQCFRYVSVIGISLGISKPRSKNRRAHLTSCSTEVGGIRNHAKLTVM